MKRPTASSGENCPVCGEMYCSGCRCSGPHTVEDLMKGHGRGCANGHRWSGDVVYDPKTASGRTAFQEGDIVTVDMNAVRQEIPAHGGPKWYKGIRRALGRGWGALKIWELHGDEAEVIANHPLGIADGIIPVPVRLLRMAKDNKEAGMNRTAVAQELVEVARLLAGAGTFECPNCGTKVLENTGYCVKCEKKVKKAARWESLPRGWTESSLSSFYKSLAGAGDAKAKFYRCVDKIGDSDVTDPNAFCGSLLDRFYPDKTWRGVGR